MVAETSPIDHTAAPREGMEVRGALGKLLGKVGRVDTDDMGQPASITIKHGLLGRKEKQVPAHEIKEVTGDTVVLRFTVVEFKQLPDLG
jgi:hypothetical protein